MTLLPPSALPLGKILLSFVGMLVLVRLRTPLGLAILAGSLILGLLFGMPLADWAMTSVAAPFEEKPLFLVAIIALIMILSHLLENSGQTQRLMRAVAGLIVSPRLRMAFFASLIGLLPMPGGAIFSAPLVRSAAESLPVPPDRLALINYWFRHVWEAAWPLYPGIILAASLAGMPIGSLIARTFPGLLLTLLLGWLMFLRPGVLPLPDRRPAARPRVDWGALLREGLPIYVAIVGSVGLEICIGLLWPALPFEWGMCLALSAAIVVAMLQNSGGPRMLLAVLASKGLWAMLLVIVGIFAFQDVLKNSGAVRALAEVSGGGAALAVTAGLLPLLVGLLTGITAAHVGATFPLILGMAHGAGVDQLPLVVLALFSGYAGVLASPLHICLVLTCQYFATDMGKVWRQLVLPSALVLASGYLYYFLLR